MAKNNNTKEFFISYGKGNIADEKGNIAKYSTEADCISFRYERIHEGDILSIQFPGDDKMLSCCTSGFIKMSNISSGTLLHTILNGQETPLISMSMHENGSFCNLGSIFLI